jgi:hypothetical protein
MVAELYELVGHHLLQVQVLGGAQVVAADGEAEEAGPQLLLVPERVAAQQGQQALGQAVRCGARAPRWLSVPLASAPPAAPDARHWCMSLRASALRPSVAGPPLPPPPGSPHLAACRSRPPAAAPRG